MYKIIAGDRRQELEYQVNEAIQSGYAPAGGVFIDKDNNWCQPMIHTINFFNHSQAMAELFAENGGGDDSQN